MKRRPRFPWSSHFAPHRQGRWWAVPVAVVLLVLTGCSAVTPRMKSATPAGAITAAEANGPGADTLAFREFHLSAGDEINIYVYKHDDLNRSLRIPPDGIFYFPLVGEIDTNGMTLKDLRLTIVEGLSRDRKQALVPGDEITIAVFRHAEYDRRLIVPSDGRIFFPYVGDIDVEGRTPLEVGKMITTGLSDLIVDPQVMVDIVKLDSPMRIPVPQVSVEVVGFGGQKFFVLGEVYRPGVFTADGGTDLIEAISMAGGATLDGKLQTVLLIRSGEKRLHPELIVADIEQALSTGDLSQSPHLQRGDIVYVPRTLIADVDRFFQHLNTIVSPLLKIETGYWIGQNIEAGPRRSSSSINTINVVP